jgi:RNA polymerase sigma-70 factor (ECF subfamily)
MFGLIFGSMLRTSDEVLVQRFKNGDRSAFSELVDRHQHRVYSLCYRWMGNQQAAEEVAQDVFVSLFRSLDRFRGDAKFSTWLYRVTVNHCKNQKLYRNRRAHGRHESLDSAPEDGFVRQIESGDRGADVGIHKSEAERALQSGLDALEEDHRQIILLRDLEDLSYDEISSLLNVAKGTVKSRLHRARTELARQLSLRMTAADVL